MQTYARDQWQVDWSPLEGSSALDVKVHELAETKYSQSLHNRRR